MAPLFGPVTIIETVIAPVQFAAVVFNLSAALPFFARGAASWFSSESVPSQEQWSQALALTNPGVANEMAKATFAASVASRRQLFCVMVCKLIIGNAFVFLTLSSLHKPYPVHIQWMLLCLTLALSYLLTVMAAGVSSGWQRAADMRRLADSIAKGSRVAHPASVSTVAAAGVISLPDAPWFEAVKVDDPFGTNAVRSYVSELNTAHTSFMGNLSKLSDSVVESLNYHSRKQWLTTYLDATTFTLNAIAFVGYGMFPVTYFIPEATLSTWAPAWPGHDAAQFWGNLAGDVAWTIEAALLIVVPMVINTMLGAAPTSKSKKE